MNEQTYCKIADTAIEIYRSTAPRAAAVDVRTTMAEPCDVCGLLDANKCADCNKPSGHAAPTPVVDSSNDGEFYELLTAYGEACHLMTNSKRIAEAKDAVLSAFAAAKLVVADSVASDLTAQIRRMRKTDGRGDDVFRCGFNGAIDSVLALLAAAKPVSVDAGTDKEKIAGLFLQDADSAALYVFHNQCEDSDADGYTERAEMMDRLAELGVVQRLSGRGRRFGVTAFGHWLIEAVFAQDPLFPLRTIAEHNARETAGHALYLKEAPPHSTAWVELPRAERESWRRKATPPTESTGEPNA